MTGFVSDIRSGRGNGSRSLKLANRNRATSQESKSQRAQSLAPQRASVEVPVGQARVTSLDCAQDLKLGDTADAMNAQRVVGGKQALLEIQALIRFVRSESLRWPTSQGTENRGDQDDGHQAEGNLSCHGPVHDPAREIYSGDQSERQGQRPERA